MRPDRGGQIANFLASNREFIIADVWTLVTVYGEVLTYSGYTIPLTVPAGLFDQHSALGATSTPVVFGLGPKFGRGKITTKIGLAVDTLDLAIYAGPNDSVGNLSWQMAFFNGVFDLATIELGRVVCQPQPGGGIAAIRGYVVWFQGLVGDVEIGRTQIAVTVNSTLTLLTAQYPRRMWQHTCNHVFGDNMCLFDRQSMAVTVTAQAGSTPFQIVHGYTPNPTNLYDGGTIVGLSGANTGLKRTIGSGDLTASLTSPYVYPVTPGDMFTMLPGCDHTLNSCQNLFNNLQHFGGMPYIPQAEFAV